MTYRAPVADIAFALKHGAGLSEALARRPLRRPRRRPRRRGAGGGRPVRNRRHRAAQRVGDRHGTPFKDGAVTTPPGWKEAYRAWAAAGWNGLAAPAEWGGQALPHALNAACIEMWNAASMAFGIGPVLTMAAIDALAAHGTDELKRALSAPSSCPASGWAPCSSPSRRPAPTFRSLRAKAERAERHLPHHRAEDLHHLRRARSDRQHRAFRAGAAPRRAARQPGHLALPGAEIPGERGRLARRAQRRARAFDRAQARHPCARRPAPWSTATRAAPSASSSARSIAGSPACSR